MITRIVQDGLSRLRRSAAHQARLRLLRTAVEKRYSPKLASAGFFRRIVLHWRMESEFRRARRKIEPSRWALYCQRAVGGP